MSELFYLFSEIDDRVRPLVFCVRRWAQSVKVTMPCPGSWISNFGLTCMVIFFLQQLKRPILPSLQHLCQRARPQDRRTLEFDGTAVSFLRDLSLLDFRTTNTDSLQDLLLQFFDFASQMNFKDRALSIFHGHDQTKPDNGRIYIVNPLEPDLNVTRNVNAGECDRLQAAVRTAFWLLQSEISSKNRSPTHPWGILGLLQDTTKEKIQPEMFYDLRMMQVNNLFDLNDDKPKSGEKPVKFVSTTMKNTVKRIKQETKQKIFNKKLTKKT